MPRMRLSVVLLAAALLSVGQAAAALVTTGTAERAELVPSSSHIAGAVLPDHVFPAAALVELDLRGVRPVSSVLGSSDRPRRVHGCRSSSSTAAGDPDADYFVARLLRGGIHNSSLGTPPPQS